MSSISVNCFNYCKLGGKEWVNTLVLALFTCAPAFIIAPGVKPQKITSPIDAALLAPTVARILRIRSPNGARMMPLSLKD